MNALPRHGAAPGGGLRGGLRGRTTLLLAAFLLACVLAAPAFAAAGRTVRVGVYQNKPKVFMDGKGRPGGIFIDLVKEIAVKEGWELKFVPGTWDEEIRALQRGEIDLMPDVAWSQERARTLDFHKRAVIESWSYLYAAPGRSLERFQDLDGKSVAVLKGSIQETILKQKIQGFGYRVRVRSVNSLIQAFQLASTGEVDAAVANYLFGDYHEYQYRLTKTPIAFGAVSLFYATAKGRNSDLLRAIDAHLVEWMDTPGSSYYGILSHYIAKAPKAGLPEYVFWILSTAALLIAGAVVFIVFLRWQVRVRTGHLSRAVQDLKVAYESTLSGWSRALDMRDSETEGHTLRVTEMAIELARRMGVPEEGLENIRRGALLHDIGKLGVPDSILLKMGLLDEEEWIVMREHPRYAMDMLLPIEYLGSALDIPYYHHERWDGSGYPLGLSGKSIPLSARIFAVIDVWDALRSDRPYREAWSDEEAYEHIRLGAGSHFDPKIVEVFMRMIDGDDEPEPERS